MDCRRGARGGGGSLVAVPAGLGAPGRVGRGGRRVERGLGRRHGRRLRAAGGGRAAAVEAPQEARTALPGSHGRHAHGKYLPGIC